jgi:hypothetical protein
VSWPRETIVLYHRGYTQYASPGARTIFANTLHAAGAASPWEAPPPVLLNTWKHHAAALRCRIREAVQAGAPGLDELASRLVVIGTELMDVYTGQLLPAEIGTAVVHLLQTEGRLALPAYRTWLTEGGNYRVLTLVEDASRWVLRLGDVADRYVHVHPGRWAPATCRIRANVLKTAVMVLAHAGVHGGEPTDLEQVNRVRRAYLDLAPMGDELVAGQGLEKVIGLLRESLA